MSKIVWDKTGEHIYETGVDHGVLYLYKEADPEVSGDTAGFKDGVAWNGLTAVNENPSGAEPNPFYADNIKYLNLLSAEDYGATIQAFTYPDEFEACDGLAEIAPGVTIGQQPRKLFGLCYRTLIGNDIQGTNYGYKLHMVYNCQASPSSKEHGTVNESPEAGNFSWEVSTTPVEVTDQKPTAVLTIDSTKTDAVKLAALEAILYGGDGTEPRLPYPNEIATLMAE